jgi:hypothetical protein
MGNLSGKPAPDQHTHPDAYPHPNSDTHAWYRSSRSGFFDITIWFHKYCAAHVHLEHSLRRYLVLLIC